MTINDLTIANIPELLPLIQSYLFEKGTPIEALPNQLSIYEKYFRQELGQNFHAYGLYSNGRIVSVIGYRIIKRPIETIAEIDLLYTLSEFRNQHFQTEKLLPYFSAQLKKKGLVILEINNSTSSAVTDHIFEEILALSKNVPLYCRLLPKGYKALPNQDYSIQTHLVNSISTLVDFKNTIDKTILQAVIDISNTLPNEENPSGMEANINIYHTSIPQNYKQIEEQEIAFLQMLFQLLSESGIPYVKVHGHNLTENALNISGLQKVSNAIRGLNPSFNVDSKLSLKI